MTKVREDEAVGGGSGAKRGCSKRETAAVSRKRRFRRRLAAAERAFGLPRWKVRVTRVLQL